MWGAPQEAQLGRPRQHAVAGEHEQLARYHPAPEKDS